MVCRGLKILKVKDGMKKIVMSPQGLKERKGHVQMDKYQITISIKLVFECQPQQKRLSVIQTSRNLMRTKVPYPRTLSEIEFRRR